MVIIENINRYRKKIDYEEQNEYKVYKVLKNIQINKKSEVIEFIFFNTNLSFSEKN